MMLYCNLSVPYLVIVFETLHNYNALVFEIAIHCWMGLYYYSHDTFQLHFK